MMNRLQNLAKMEVPRGPPNRESDLSNRETAFQTVKVYFQTVEVTFQTVVVTPKIMVWGPPGNVEQILEKNMKIMKKIEKRDFSSNITKNHQKTQKIIKILQKS